MFSLNLVYICRFSQNTAPDQFEREHMNAPVWFHIFKNDQI